jgi:hypothetical protein
MKILKRAFNKFDWSPHALFLWLAIILPPAVYFYFVITYSLNLPFADDFANLSETISIFQSTNFNETLSVFFALENGHRPAFTRLIYALSYVLFEEINFRTLILIGNISLALLLLLFFKTLKVSHSKLFYFIPVPILLFQFQFWKNMTWVASALAHQYILLFTGLTFYLLSRKSNPGFYCAFFFAVLSVFTHGSGWVTIFLGWIILLLQKSYQKSSIWAGGALLSTIFYFKNFHTNTNIFVGIQSLEGFKNFLMFYSAFLGSSLSLDNIYIAAAFGVILSFYLFYLTWDKYFEKNITIFMFMVYIFLNAILVAMARSGLAVENVFAPRYKIVSVILIILVYMSLVEKLSTVIKEWRKFVAIGVIFAATSYFITFKSGKDNLETRSNSLTWMANQWINTNHGFFFRSGTPGAEDRIPNSILLKAIGDEFYKLPYEILGMPDSAYSSSTILPKTCEIEKKESFNAKFSIIPIGPVDDPHLIRIEGMIHYPISKTIENNSSIHIILQSKDRSYIFETHPQHYLHGSIFFENSSPMLDLSHSYLLRR